MKLKNISIKNMLLKFAVFSDYFYNSFIQIYFLIKKMYAKFNVSHAFFYYI